MWREMKMKVGTAADCMSTVQSAYTHCCGTCHVVILKYACCLAQVEREAFCLAMFTML